MNLRPSGYEPDELPGCSIPRHQFGPQKSGPVKARSLLVNATKWTFEHRKWVQTRTSCLQAPAAKPGDVLLFRCLSNSTIGADWFHGRVRDGIGWVTDAMVTKLCSRRSKKCAGSQNQYRAGYAVCILTVILGCDQSSLPQWPATKAVIDGGTLKARTEQLGPVSSTHYCASTSGLSTWWSSTAR